MSAAGSEVSSVTTALAQAEALIEVGRALDAREVLAPVLATQADARVWALDATAARLLGDVEGAVSSAGQAVARAPEWPAGLAELALSLTAADRATDGLPIIARAISHTPEDPWVATVASIVMRHTGHHDDALAAAETVIRLTPEGVAGHELAGRACEAAGRPADAERHVRDALALDPQRAATVRYLADLVRTQKRDAEALSLYTRALGLDPEDSWSTAQARAIFNQLRSRARGWALVAGAVPAVATFVLFSALGQSTVGFCLAVAGLLLWLPRGERMLLRGAEPEVLDAVRDLHQAQERRESQGAYRAVLRIFAVVLVTFGLVSLSAPPEVTPRTVTAGFFAGGAALFLAALVSSRLRPLPGDLRRERRQRLRAAFPAIGVIVGGFCLLVFLGTLASDTSRPGDRVAGVGFGVVGTALLVAAASVTVVDRRRARAARQERDRVIGAAVGDAG